MGREVRCELPIVIEVQFVGFIDKKFDSALIESTLCPFLNIFHLKHSLRGIDRQKLYNFVIRAVPVQTEISRPLPEYYALKYYKDWSLQEAERNLLPILVQRK